MKQEIIQIFEIADLMNTPEYLQSGVMSLNFIEMSRDICLKGPERIVEYTLVLMLC